MLEISQLKALNYCVSRLNLMALNPPKKNMNIGYRKILFFHQNSSILKTS